MVIQKNVLLTVTTVVLFVLPILYVVFWKAKSNAHWKPLFLGALGFVISARVLEMLVHLVFIVYDNPVSRAINGSTLLYVLYGITMAGVFEEVGRWIMFTVFCKRMDSREDALMYGIGHGGIEVWTVTLPVMLIYLLVAVTGGAGLPAETVTAVMDAANAFGTGAAVCFVMERVFCMGIHISLTLIVFYGARCRKKGYLFLAVILHMAVDVLPALYQRGVVGLFLTEVWLGVGCVLLCFVAHRYYRRIIS